MLRRQIGFIVYLGSLCVLSFYLIFQTYPYLFFPGLFNSHPPQVLSLMTKEPELKLIALSFDDGPSENTPLILQILQEKNVSASFFVVGKRALTQREILLQILSQGHEIGNHTWDHQIPFTKTQGSVDYWLREISLTQAVVAAQAGYSPTLFRAPYGEAPDSLASAAAQANLKLVKWNIDPQDWRPKITKEEIVSEVLKQATPSGMILLHDGPPGLKRSATIEALPELIDRLRAQGYTLVKISELLISW